MKRRILAAMLWYYVGWYAMSWITQATALPDALGPIVGLALAVAVASDPGGRIWRSGSRMPGRAEAAATVPMSSGIQGT
jgi:hypothetical protein